MCGGDEVAHSDCFRQYKPQLSPAWLLFGGSKLLFGGSILSFGGSKLWFGGSKRNDGPHLKMGKANDRADYSASIRS